MIYAFAFNVFPDRVSGSGKQLAGSIENSFMKIFNKIFVQIFYKKFKIQSFCICALPAVVAVLSFELIVTVFTGYHICLKTL